jgi:hypothetical protein
MNGYGDRIRRTERPHGRGSSKILETSIKPVFLYIRSFTFAAELSGLASRSFSGSQLCEEAMPVVLTDQ